MGGRFRFAVIADSHVRFPDDGVDEYPSNALMVDRSRYVVDLCNRLKPAFVVHLGDIVHPLPADPAHEAAVHLAREVFSGLDMPIHFAPGNHDIGDKPHSLVAVPSVADKFYDVFQRTWGPPFTSFDHDGCHFVLIDTPVLNSGLSRESDQGTWLENDLAAAAATGRKIFVFGHYPPFVRDADESEHYDNLAEPARKWLLDLLAEHRVQALFSGHVHNFFYNRHRDVDLYITPSTGFVRPDYAEMTTVAPGNEGGRDDAAKLGFFMVDVFEDGHRVRPIRTYGSAPAGEALPIHPERSVSPDWASPLGVAVRHGWASTIDLPTEGLDEFRRKTVRNDYPILALWEARIPSVRVPVGDIGNPDARIRLRHLNRLGLQFTVVSAGPPDAETLRAVTDLGPALERWMLVLTSEQLPSALAMKGDLRRLGLRLALAPVVPVGSADENIHHFVSHGFDAEGDGLLDQWLEAEIARLADELVYRVAPQRPVGQALAAASATSERAGLGAVVNLEMPRAGENETLDDDAVVATRVREAVRAAREHPNLAVFLDTFVDHDRSYYRRHGLIDRRFNPRPALYELTAGH